MDLMELPKELNSSSTSTSKTVDAPTLASTSFEENMTNKQRKCFRQGMGFLLNKIREDDTHKCSLSESEEQQPPNEKKTIDVINAELAISITDVDKVKYDFDGGQQPLLVPKREDVKLLIEPLFLNGVAPIQTINYCFMEGTTPDFGHIRKLIGENNYVRSCKWSSDGQWLIVDSIDRFVRIFSFYGEELSLKKKVPLGGIIYDMQWAPPNSMQTHFITTSRDQPIHCWNVKGQSIASFRGINEQDELESAYSICFSLNGNKIFAGYRNCLKIFDFERGSKQIQEIRTFRKGVLPSQKGPMSAIAICPSFDGVFAAASYNGSLGLYSTHTNSCDSLINVNGPAITHMQYSSTGNLLFAGLRNSPFIKCYDLRMPTSLYANYRRPAQTNQRFYFQLDPCDHYLYTGSSTGDVLIFDLKNEGDQLMRSENGEMIIEANGSLKCSAASVSGLSLHPIQQIMAITTGQRVFPDLVHELFPEEDDMFSTSYAQKQKLEDGKENETTEKREMAYTNGTSLDNSIKLYKFFESNI